LFLPCKIFTQEVLGVITEREIARLAYATARLTD
jgi:hypothetical protein